MKLESNNMKRNICEETELLVDDYLDGMISTEDKLKMEEHLHSCSACRKYIEETVLLIEKAVLISKDDNVPEGKKTELWNKIEAKINTPDLSDDTHIYSMSGLKDECTPLSEKSDGVQTVKRGAWSSFRYYMSGMAAVLIIAFVIYGVNQFMKRNNDINFTNNIVDVGGPKWKVTSVKGSPMLNNLVMKVIDSVGIGGYITTDADSRAELYVAGLGSVIIEPNTKVRLVKSIDGEHRIALEYGSIDANILAKPRTFFVDAGTVTAVDLGCSYKFSIDKKGDGLLYVRSGRVALESSSGRESIVPEGKYCVTKKEFGPGTPFREDSSPQFRQALMDFDFGNCGSKCINVILKNAKKTDAVTLVNIIPRVDAEYKTRVYEKVANFCPPPNNIPTDSIPKLRKLENLNEWVDKIMEEVHKNIEENMEKVEKQIEEQMKNLDAEKWNNQWQKHFDKNFKNSWKFYVPHGNDTLIFRDGDALSPEDMEELQRDLQEMQNELQFDNEEFKREMERVREELQRTHEEARREMEKVQREIEQEQRKQEFEERKQERKEEQKQREQERKDREKEEKEREKERMKREKEHEQDNDN